MMYLKRAAAVLLGLVATGAFAGEPVETEVDCPISTEKVSVLTTTSCSVSNWGVYMSLRRPTSCDFVARMPKCKKERFPIYKTFAPDELPRLQQIVKAPWYQSAKSESPYLRAYLIEKDLGARGAEGQFWLLQQGHFHDPQNTYGNGKYYEAFKEAANAFLKVAKKEDRKVVLLMAAFARVHSDEPQKAQQMLRLAEREMDDSDGFFDDYAARVNACISRPKAEECAPMFLFDPND